MSLMKEYSEQLPEMRKLSRAMAVCILISGLIVLPAVTATAHAADGANQKGIQEDYGEKQKITSPEEARKALKKYFAGRDVIIGEVIEKEIYFEADIKDRNNTVIDKVIVNKRTGRIRSIY